MTPKPRIVLVGASGFIGIAAAEALRDRHDVTVLTRSRARVERAADAGVTWRQCDLFKTSEVEKAFVGFAHAVYLVNNMVPSAKLSQAECRDMDVLVADNVGRAAARAGVKQIICLGLVIPNEEIPADMRASREEVPRALGSHGTPVTTLRAGLIVGPGGTLVRVVADLATRPPIVLLPRWANGRKQPIALSDVVRAIVRAVGDETLYDKSLDLGGPRILDVREILRRAAKLFGRPRRVFLVPLMPPFLFRWWVRMVSPRVHPDLVRRTVATLPYDTVARDNPLQREIVADAIPARTELKRTADHRRLELSQSPRTEHRSDDDAVLRSERRVRSIQRLSLPKGKSAQWAVEHYFTWLPRFFLHLMKTQEDGQGGVRFVSRFPRIDLLRMRSVPEQCSPDRMVYRIEGGLLAHAVASPSARLEFREVLDGRYLIAAIHDYRPTLPWVLYVATQSIVHLLAMKTYAWHLKRLSRASG